MKIGIVSDSHGKTGRLKSALELLRRRGARVVVHCGDILSKGCVEQLGRFEGKAYLVAGNMDRGSVERIAKFAAARGVSFERDFITVPLGDGQMLAATHGHIESLLEELIAGGQFRYVCHGHTHRRCDETLGLTRVLNPGALYHPRDTKRHTVMLLDSEADTVEVITVER